VRGVLGAGDARRLSRGGELLRRHVQDPVRELERLRDWQITNYLFGNYDGRAKNLSILYEPTGSVPVLAPFYDTVCIELMTASA
jgi:serine/threonine protein kinase HipA of HipAB toxin-antitoxin module